MKTRARWHCCFRWTDIIASVLIIASSRPSRRLPQATQGQLTSGAVQLVSNRALYNLAQQLHLERYVALNGEFMASPIYMSRWGGVCGVDILCDAVEALIGAIDQDQGYEAARRFVLRLLKVTFLATFLSKCEGGISILGVRELALCSVAFFKSAGRSGCVGCRVPFTCCGCACCYIKV